MIPVMDTIAVLRRCQLFRELSNEEMELIGSVAAIHKLGKGEILFLEGDDASGFYLLLSGRMRVYKSSPEGKEHTLHLINPGQAFGEAAAFTAGQFPANSAALEASQVAFIPVTEFKSILAASPNISLKMIAGLSAFLREFNQMVESLSLKEVPARLADYLLDLPEKSPGSVVTLDRSKTELAHHLGTANETLSRNFRKFKELGAVEVAGRRITILDRQLLAEIAAGKKI